MDNEIYKYWRVGLRWDVFPDKLWPNRTIPYAISPLYDAEDMITIYTAIRTLSTMTCIKFRKWNGKEDDFLLIWPIKYPKVSFFSNEELSITLINNNEHYRVVGALLVKLVVHNYYPFKRLMPQDKIA